MNKALSIALVFLLLLNVMGYYAVLLCLEWQHNRETETRLDRDEFNASRTITIKLPLSIPYVQDAREFERVQGIFQHNGSFYRLIKQKYAADTLTIICIRDDETQRLQNALNRYVSTLIEDRSEQQGDSKPFVSFIKEYILIPFSLSPQTSGWQADLEKTNRTGDPAAAYRMLISPPPEVPGVFRIVWVPECQDIKKVQVPFGLGFLHLFYLYV